MDFNWKSKILKAARHVKSKKKKPSMDIIYETINNESEHDVDINKFKEEFNELIKNEILVNIKPNEEQGSYHICNEKLYEFHNDYNNRLHSEIDDNGDDGQIDDGELINMIKNMIIDAKVNDANTIKHLKEEIYFLKGEIVSKNNIIITLLDIFKNDKKRSIETSLVDVKTRETIAVNNNTPERHLIEHDDDDFKSQNSPMRIHGNNMYVMADITESINKYNIVDAYNNSNDSWSVSNTNSDEINDECDDDCNNEHFNNEHVNDLYVQNEQEKANNIKKQINEVRSDKHLKYLAEQRIRENSNSTNNISKISNISKYSVKYPL